MVRVTEVIEEIITFKQYHKLDDFSWVTVVAQFSL